MIGIISDTHEQKGEMQKAIKIFKSRNVKLVVHCGDLISPPTLDLFKGMKVIMVFGNNDGEKAGLNKKAESNGFERITETKEFEYENKKFFVSHGHAESILEEAIKSQRYDYILTGHTHKKRDERVGRTRIINPGSLFTDNENTIAILDANKDKLIFEKVE